jgi:hypothetical protein
MDVNQILQLISSVGFPIVCCGAMAWYVKYNADKEREERTKMNEQHKVEMHEVTEALNNNTLALQKLCDKLGEE